MFYRLLNRTLGKRFQTSMTRQHLDLRHLELLYQLRTTKVPTKIRPRNKLAHTTSGHKINGWREEELRNRLYMNNHVRLKMDISCVPYFKVLCGIIPYRASSKNAGIQLEKETFRRVNKTL